jgi:hypothetical protein
LLKGQEVYFRGNYNKARFCTQPNSNFVEMAIGSLLADKEVPNFNELATTAYGCSYQVPDNSIERLTSYFSTGTLIEQNQ